MALVRCDRIQKHFGAQVVLDGASCDLQPGEKVGCIGRNGGGKSTLIRILTGELEPDGGQVIRRKGVRIGYLPQVPDIAPGNDLRTEALRAFDDVFAMERKLRALEEAMAAPADDAALARAVDEHGHLQERFEQAGGYIVEHKVDAALMGLGFAAADFAKPVTALSGGEKNRLALAKLLVSDPDLLVLDEPTNFLDLRTTQWLEDFLRGAQPAVLVVSHDRYFLDRVAQRILEVDAARCTSWRGNYSAYQAQRAEQDLTQGRAYANQQAYIAKEEEFIRRHIAGQRTKEAQGRRTRLERLERIPAPRVAPEITLRFGQVGRSSTLPLEVHGLTKSYGDRTLFRDVGFRLDRGSRLAIMGPNGAGKSTLLGILRGTISPDAGTVTWGHGVTAGWYDQEQQDLSRADTALDAVRAARPKLDDESLRTFLGALLFTEDEVFKRVGDLSGGERARVALARLMLQAGNFLVLDEPTNHCDIPSRAAIERALQRYEGTVVMVSHDRYLIDELATDLLVLGPERPRMRSGNYTHHLEREAAARRAQADAAAPPKNRPRKAPKASAAKPALPKARTLDAIEADIEAAEEEIAALNAALADSTNWTDGNTMRSLQQQLEARQAELLAFEAEWDAAAG